MRRPEDALCMAIHRWNELQKPAAIIFHVPNGGKRTKAEAAIFKAMGVRAGVFDYIVLMPGIDGDHPYAGFIEIKDKDGRMSEAQRQFKIEVESMGFMTAVVRSLDEWVEVLERWGVRWGKKRVA